MSELRLDVGTANELKLGMRSARAADGSEWTDADVKNLASSDFLGKILSVLRGQAEIVMKKVVGPFLFFIKTVVVPAIAGEKTSDCFTDKSLYAYRDANIDRWLPTNQPKQGESKFLVWQLTQSVTFAQIIRDFLGAPDTATIPELTRILREIEAVTTLPTIEYLINRREGGKDVGLQTGGPINFFFVEDKENGVSVVRADHCDGLWGVSVDSLDYGGIWSVVHRFFFRNKTL